MNRRSARRTQGPRRVHSSADTHASASEPADPLGRWIIPVYLALVTTAAFVGIFQNGFVNWDDGPNLVDNIHYRGLGWPQLRWMLTTFLMGHWIPLTWMTFGLDYLVWGMNPVGYHLTNLLLHIANVVTFYFVAARLLAVAHPSAKRDVGLQLGAALAALLFAVHPLRVESVAWATERRDVLCGLFYLLAILFYLRAWRGAAGGSVYGRRRYWASLALFALALLSKSMAVSLPAVLLVLDVYPLRRLGGRGVGWFEPAARRVWLEKVPFALLSVGASVVALVALNDIKGIRPIVALDWLERVTISLYSLAFYLGKMLVPVELSPVYELPYRIDPLAWPYLLAAGVVTAVTAGAVALRRRWLAFLAVWVSYMGLPGSVWVTPTGSDQRFCVSRGRQAVSCLRRSAAAPACTDAGKRARRRDHEGGGSKALALDERLDTRETSGSER
jgi:hypothetical protein